MNDFGFASSMDGVLRKLPSQLRLRFIARWRRVIANSNRSRARKTRRHQESCK